MASFRSLTACCRATFAASAISISSASSDEDEVPQSPARPNIVEVTEARAPPSINTGAGKIADKIALPDGGAAQAAKDAAPNHADEAVDVQVLHTDEEEARLALVASSADHDQKTKSFVAAVCAGKDRQVQLYEEKEKEARRLQVEKEELEERNKRLEKRNKRLEKEKKQLKEHAEKFHKAVNDFKILETEGPTASSDAEHSDQGEGYDNGEEEENEANVTVEVHRTPPPQSKQ